MTSVYVDNALTTAIRIAASRPVRALLSPLLAGRASIFLLHRLSATQRDPAGHTAQEVRAIIKALRASGAQFVSFMELLDAAHTGRPIPRNAVVFTIDDGFHDQVELARTFLREDCPVTVFLTTGFLDGKTWPWFEQISYAFLHSPLTKVSITTTAASATYELHGLESRLAAAADFSASAKRIYDVSPADLLDAVARATQVDLPQTAPEEHRAMSWDDVRTLEQEGVEFGAHTVSHRIMSHLSDDDARFEIHESIARVRAETRRKLPIFAWPNGRCEDYGQRDIVLLREAGVRGCLATDDDYADFTQSTLLDHGIFELKRFGLPHTVRDALQYGSGIERAKQLVRRRIAVTRSHRAPQRDLTRAAEIR